MVQDLRRERGRSQGFPDVVFVFQADVEAGRGFFAEHWPEARAVADPDHALYSAFGLRRGTLGQLLGPAVWKAGWRALRRGHGVGRPVGDVRLMPGLFLIARGAVVWSHDFDHAGDQPDWDAVRTAAEAA